MERQGMLNGLDLFSGIGGISIALADWIRPKVYCEIDKYCQGVLLSRMVSRSIPIAPIWEDIQTLSARMLGEIDIIYGGFPCQDISVAGNGAGLEGKRSGLFFQIVRLAKEIQPKFIFLENVPAITARGGLRVVREIAEMGYDCRWCVISAASVGALHRRERWFLLAHSSSKGANRHSEREKKELPLFGIGCNVSHTASQQSRGILKFQSQPHPFDGSNEDFKANWWKSEPHVGRVADGIPQRVDRLRALGNAVVPIQAKEAFQILMGLK